LGNQIEEEVVEGILASILKKFHWETREYLRHIRKANIETDLRQTQFENEHISEKSLYT